MSVLVAWDVRVQAGQQRGLPPRHQEGMQEGRHGRNAADRAGPGGLGQGCAGVPVGSALRGILATSASSEFPVKVGAQGVRHSNE